MTSCDRELVSFFMEIEPVAASRPRVSSHGTYYAGPYKLWLKEAPKEVPWEGEPLEGHLGVHLTFMCTKAKTSKLTSPRGDIDNYVKAVLDVITKRGLWEDDSQVTRLTATKKFTAKGETAGVLVRITKED